MQVWTGFETAVVHALDIFASRLFCFGSVKELFSLGPASAKPDNWGTN
jgi:hypothetical protein